MAYVDPNDNILKWENGDVVTPQAAKMNMHLDSVGTVTNALRRRGTYTVNNIPERTALVNTIGASNISNSNPLMVWRANADVGKRLEYTENGGTWHYVKTSQDVVTKVSVPRNTSQTTSGELWATFDGLVVTAWGTVTCTVSNPVSSVTLGTLPASIPGPSTVFDNEIRPAIASSGTNQTLVGRFASKDLQIVNRLATGVDRIYFWGQYFV